MDILNIISELYEFYCLEENAGFPNVPSINLFNIKKVNKEQAIALYYFINGKEKQLISNITDLKNNFFFIGIHSLNNWINFLIYKQNFDANSLLLKINNAKWLRAGIKYNIKIDEFPLINYYLEVDNTIYNQTIYDKVYLVKNISEKNINSNKYNNFININNSLNLNNNIQFAQDEKIKELEKLLREEKNINKSLYERINQLENSLNEKVNQNEELKLKLKNFEDLLNTKTNELNNKITELNDKTNKLNELEIMSKNELDNLKSKLKIYPFELKPGEKMMSIIIWSINQEVHCSFICKNTDLFVHIELKIYEKYPNYSENENYFTAHGIKINKYKTLEINKIKDSDIIILNPIK